MANKKQKNQRQFL